MRALRTSALLVLALSLLAAHSMAAPGYVGRVTLPVEDAQALAAADFDQDGAIDVAVASLAQQEVHVFFGRGDGTFLWPAQVLTTERGPVLIQSALLDADGFPDLLIVQQFGDVPSLPTRDIGDLEILTNSGGPPGSPDRFPAALRCGDLYLDHCNPTDGAQPIFALAGDFNQDSALDLVASSALGSTVQTFLQGSTVPVACNPPAPCPNQDACGFGLAACDSNLTWSSNPAGLLAGRFTPDVSATEIELLSLNNFTDPAEIRHHIRSATPGATDPFIALRDNFYEVGDGITRGLGARAMVALELNQDSKPDVAVAAELSGEVSVLLNVSTNQLTSPVLASSQEYPAGDTPSWIAVGGFVLDTTGDTKQGVAVPNRASGRVSLLRSPGDGTLTDPAWWQAGPDPARVATADTNADGMADVLLTGGNALSSILSRLDPNGGLATAPHTALSSAASTSTSGDFDGDGLADLALALEAAPGLSVLLGRGDGSFRRAGFPPPLTPPTAALAAGRFNEDNLDDLAVAAPNGLRILFAAGHGSFLDAGLVVMGVPADVVAAAFEGPRVDVAVSFPAAGEVCLFESGACNSITAGPCIPTGGTPTRLAVGDFDQSNAGNCPGCLDLAVLDTPSSTVTVLRRESGGGFTPRSPVATGGQEPLFLAAAELDGDSAADLAVTHAGSDVRLLLSDTTGGFNAGQIVDLDFDPRAVVAAELDQTAGADVAVLLRDAASVILLQGAGDGTLRADERLYYGVGRQPRTLTAAVFDNAQPSQAGLAVGSEGDALLTLLGPTPRVVFPPADAGPERSLDGSEMNTLGSPAEPFLSYAWIPTTGLSAPDAAMPDLDGSQLTGDTTYTVTVTHAASGWTAQDQVAVTVKTPPAPDISPANPVYCLGSPPLVLDAGVGYTSYAWSNAAVTRCISVAPSVTTAYDVTVTGWDGAAGNSQVQVTVEEQPAVRATVSPPSLCEQAEPCGSFPAATSFPAEASASTVPTNATVTWSVVGSPPGWEIVDPNAQVTQICAESVGSATVRLDIATPGGCSDSQEFSLEVLSSGSSATPGNTLQAVKNGGSVELSWADVGCVSYDIHQAPDKAGLPGPVIGTSPTPSYTDSAPPPSAYYTIMGTCP